MSVAFGIVRGLGGNGNSSAESPNNVLYIIIAAVAATAVMGSIFLFRIYACRSSNQQETSWDEECQDPATKRRSRLKSLMEEKSIRAEYKDYKILQRRRMSTMVSSFDEGSIDGVSEEEEAKPAPPEGEPYRHLHMVVSMLQLESKQSAEDAPIAYSKNIPMNWATDCAVCLGEYKPDDKVCELECGHVFHEDCLFKWFLRSDSVQCPLCRYDLEDDSSPPRNRRLSEERSLVGFSRSPLNNV